MPIILFRPARDTDLAQIYDVFQENEVGDLPTVPPPGGVPSDLRHTLATGTMHVAEQDGCVLAYAAAITRGPVAFLTDLFVRPAHQSAQLGGMLLRRVLPQDERIHCTFSSTDPRALALYIRVGMRPQWPHFNLRLDGPLRTDLPPADVEIVEAGAGDPELARWDARIGGRPRSADHAYWVREQRAVPLWFRRQGDVVGYGYVRPGAGTPWDPDACRLGPIGVATPEEAAACVLAAIRWARARADVLLIDVPGPHPCLAPLLDAGFRIVYVETFVSAARTPFFDARCYVASGSNLG